MEILAIILGISTDSLLSALVGLLGSRRSIGFGWSFFISVLLTPVVGLIIVLMSDKLPYGEKKWGCMTPVILIFIIAAVCAIGAFYLLTMAL